MSTFETTEGIDVELDVSPDTPAAYKRVNPVLAYIDQLANALNAIDPEWTLDLTVGGIPITTITAEPANTERTAA